MANYSQLALKAVQAKQSEIERLKAELELRTRERDQATKNMEVEGEAIIFKGIRLGDLKMRLVVGYKTQDPDLYAHLAGRGE